MIGISAPVSFTRPADTTAYTAGDLIANSTTAGSVVPMTFNCASVGRARATVKRARLTKSATSATNASFALHLFDALPTVVNGDNGALVVSSLAGYIGAILIDASTGGLTGSAGLSRFGLGDLNFDVGKTATQNRKLYGLLAAVGAYAPASAETFEVTLDLSVED